MIDIKDLRVGQTLYLVRKGYEGNVHKEELDRVREVKVVKVGRRYVTVDTCITTETFDSQKDFKIYNNYGYMKMKCGLYACAKDYIDELKRENILRKVKDFFSYSGKQCDLLSLEELESINNIVKKY